MFQMFRALKRLKIGPALPLAAALGVGLVAEVSAQGGTQNPGLNAQVAERFEVSKVETFRVERPFTLKKRIRQTVPYEGEAYEMVLQPYSNRAKGFRVLVQGDDGALREVDPGPVTTYRGRIDGRPGSVVAASVLAGRLEGQILLADGTELWFGSVAERVLNAPNDLYAVFDASDRLAVDGVCAGGVGEQVVLPRPDEIAGNRGEGETFNIFTSTLGLDADFEYYSEFGDVDLTRARMEAVVNTVNVQYESEVDIHHEVTDVVVRTSDSTDPYTATDAEDLLDEMVNEWENNVSATPSHAHLFTGKPLDGSTVGLAYIGTVCQEGFEYGLSQANYSSNYANVTDLVAHELGHNWNATHCSCTNPDYTMNPNITGANTFNASVTVPDIVAYRDGQGSDCNGGKLVLVNDHCANAVPISDGLTDFRTIRATTDGFAHDSCGTVGSVIGQDVWYTYTAPIDGELLVTTCEDLGAFADFDTFIAVYDADGAMCPPEESSLIACNDDDPSSNCGTSAGGFKSTLRIDVTEGEELLIRVGGFGFESAGDGELLVRTTPPNDDCEDPTAISSNTTSFSTLGATTDGQSHTSCQFDGQTYNDVWYTYTAPRSGEITVTTCEDLGGSANFDTDLVLYAADNASCPPSDAVLLACNDDDLMNPCGSSDGGFKSTLTAFVAEGEELLIRVGGFDEGNTGSGELHIDIAPVNDDCEDAVAIETPVTAFSTLGASTDGVNHDQCDFDGQTYNDVWYTYTAPCDSALTITTCEDLGGSADYDTDLAVYTTADAACPPGDFALIDCNDDDPNNPCGSSSGGFKSTIVTTVMAGEELLIRVGGFGDGDTGTGELLVECGPICPEDVTGDGSVDLKDLNLVLGNFGQSISEGDATGDGLVDLDDLNAVLGIFGEDCE
jgi:hypothetical protein